MNKVLFGIFIFSFIFIWGFIMVLDLEDKQNSIYKYVATTVGAPTSLDPLESDYANNTPAARMIYLAPLEVSKNDDLTSDVLKSFKYDTENNTIQWQVKDGLYFSDGTPITPEDVAFSVLRMLYKRPQFPIIKYIKGTSKWVKENSPLKTYPEGIRVNGQNIEIEFDRKITNPFYRFCLELFSIIPKKCVDLNTSEIVCDDIPTSGRYAILKKSDTSWVFNRKTDNTDFPQQIVFEFWNKDDLKKNLRSIDHNTVIHSDDSIVSLKDQVIINEDFAISNEPASQFNMVLLNPTAVPFKTPECRRIFNLAFTDVFSKINHSNPETSIFTKIISGYQTPTEMEQEAKKISTEQVKECKKVFYTSPPKWGLVKSRESEATINLLEKVYEQLGSKLPDPIVFENYYKLFDAFIDGVIDFNLLGSGFWTLDAAGDIQMLLTPNLHKPLRFVAQDQRLQEMLESLVQNSNDQNLYKQINQYIYDKALMGVYSHKKIFLYHKK